MGKGILSAALAALASVGAAPAPVIPAAKAVGDPAVAIHKALQVLYNTQDAAMMQRDARQAMAGYAPGYAAVSQDGVRHSRDEEFDALERLCAAGPGLRQHSRIEKLIAHAGQASLVLHQETVMKLFSPSTHQQLVLRTEGVSQDLWVHTPQGWRLTFSKTVLQRSAVGTADDAVPVHGVRQAAAWPRRTVIARRPLPVVPKSAAPF